MLWQAGRRPPRCARRPGPRLRRSGSGSRARRSRRRSRGRPSAPPAGSWRAVRPAAPARISVRITSPGRTPRGGCCRPATGGCPPMGASARRTRRGRAGWPVRGRAPGTIAGEHAGLPDRAPPADLPQADQQWSVLSHLGRELVRAHPAVQTSRTRFPGDEPGGAMRLGGQRASVRRPTKRSRRSPDSRQRNPIRKLEETETP